MFTQTRKLLGIFACAGLVAATPLNGQAAIQLNQEEEHLESLDHDILSLKERKPVLEKQIHQTERLKEETDRRIKKALGDAERLRPQLEAAVRAHRKSLDTLGDAIQIDYEAENHGAFEIAVEKKSISETLSEVSYRSAVGERLEQMADEAETSESAIRAQKERLDGVISSLEVLKRQQRALAAGLADQKRELAEAIANRENEAEYLRKQIAEANRVRGELLAGIMNGSFKDGERVDRGDIIGFEGSTGFSTGCHTHFSVIDGSRWANPSGYWEHLTRPRGAMTQPYGMTPWARSGAYGGGIHNGQDYVQGCGSSVRSSADGVVIRDTRDDGSGFGHYVMIRHRGGIVTLYGHLI